MKLKIWTVLFLIIVVCVSTGMMNAIYTYTDPMVRKNERVKIQRSILEVFDIPYREDAIEKTFEESVDVDTQTAEGMDLYRLSSGITAFRISGSGFWGAISVLIVLEPDLETIKRLKILENTETPGLGGRIAEGWFQDQFRGKKLTPELKIIPYRKAKGPNEVDAITGATQTSRALERIININVRSFYRKMKGDK